MSHAREGRHYPTQCLSAYCGRADCEGSATRPPCREWPVLREFKEWRARVGATCPDPIWSPTFWVAATAAPTTREE